MPSGLAATSIAMSSAAQVALAVDFAFLAGLSFLLGLAFEDVFARAGVRRPGGVRTFPMLALCGGVLYLFDPVHLIAFTSALLLLGAWLTVYYREHIRAGDESGQQNVGMMVMLLNIYAYLLGAMVFALPHWTAVGTTVAAVLLFTGRDRLHALAQRVDISEIVTAAQFLILTGLVLPLLPNEPVTTLTNVTPRQAWLALIVVCGFSYASYLLQRYVVPTAGGLWTAALGGMYSSTATTVVLARQSKTDPSMVRQARAGITLATGIMYLRILAVVAVFNVNLARSLSLPLAGLFFFALLISATQYHYDRGKPATQANATANRNPLELVPAVAFALTFVVISVLSGLIKTRFGIAGIYSLAAVVGVTDIDPFVLNLAQGGAVGVATKSLVAAVLIAASSNNLLKAAYAAIFAGWRISLPSVVALIVLALTGLGIALVTAGIS